MKICIGIQLGYEAADFLGRWDVGGSRLRGTGQEKPRLEMDVQGVLDNF